METTYYRKRLTYLRDKESRWNNYLVITNLLKIEELGSKAWHMKLLCDYLNGLHNKNISKMLDIMDYWCEKEYIKNWIVDQKKTTYRDWLDISPTHLMFYNNNIKGMDAKEYQKLYQKKYREKMKYQNNLNKD